MEIAHDRGVFGEFWGICDGGWWCRPGGWVLPIEMLLESSRGGILVAVGDVVPELAADQLGEESTRIGGANDPGVFGGG